MKAWDKIRIKHKIRKVCKVLKQLSPQDQEECMDTIRYCLRVSDDWKMKEHFLDMLVEGVGALCR